MRLGVKVGWLFKLESAVSPGAKDLLRMPQHGTGNQHPCRVPAQGIRTCSSSSSPSSSPSFAMPASVSSPPCKADTYTGETGN